MFDPMMCKSPDVPTGAQEEKVTGAGGGGGGG